MPFRTLGFGAFLLSAVLLAMAVLGGAIAAGPKPGAAVAVHDARVKLVPLPGRPSAGYFAVKGGAQADKLIGAASPAAERVEMHETLQINGVMRMTPVKEVAVPARQTILFQPGGRHLMIYGVKTQPKAGETIPLVLTFEKAGKVTVDAKVETLGSSGSAPAQDHSGHHH